MTPTIHFNGTSASDHYLNAIRLIERFGRELSANLAAHAYTAPIYTAGACDALAAIVSHAEHQRAILEASIQRRMH